jgi:uncharacterized membrane protein
MAVSDHTASLIGRRAIMARAKRSININAPVDKVFAYIDDPTNGPEWMPSLTEVSDVSGSGVGQHYRWKWKMVGVPLAGESSVTEHVPNERVVSENKGGVTSTWMDILEPHGDGTTLTIDVDYTIPIPVLGKLAEKLVLKRNERELELALENVKDTLES